MNGLRILAGEDLLAPGFQLLSRRAAEASRNIERPAEMFARMPQADAQAIEIADTLIERADVVELLAERRSGFFCPTLEAPADLAGQPGLALRAAPDHDGVCAGGLERRH